MPKNRLIVALDLETPALARDLVHALGNTVNFYKVGLELYAAAGPAFLNELISAGNHVFLDLKFYDIGETVRRAVAQAARTGASFLTVHASRPSCAPPSKAAATPASSSWPSPSSPPSISPTSATTSAKPTPPPVSDLVALRVRNACELGIDGLVCSPLEVARVRALAGPDAILVTPGVRSAGAAAGDQKRIATPAEALRNGADYLVVGRQVTRAPDPVAEVARITSELSAIV